MKQSQIEKNFLGIAGEYVVCAELLKRKVPATITYGNQKAIDIIVICKDKKNLNIEVKTSMSKRIVTGFFQKYTSPEALHPDFWVIVYIDEKTL